MSSEGRKDDSGKARVDLFPPKVLMACGQVLRTGAERYGEENWQLVANGRRRYLAAALRHTYAYMQGERISEEGHPHLAHAIVNLAFVFFLDDEDRKDR